MKRLIAALLAWPCLAFGQSYPAKPIRLVIPFPPGGTTDQIARIIQPKFAEHLGQPVIIESKPGAGGSIGAADVARSAPDGYTMLLVFDTHAVNHHLYKQAPDIFKQLEHVSLMTTSPSLLVAVSGFAPSNLRELVARAKADPEKVTYASAGTGSSNHLGALLLERQAGIKMTHVPFKGGGPMIVALLGNQVDITFMSTPLILAHVKSGKVKPIAIGGRQRAAQLPDVPTLAETYPGFELVSWFGILTPAGVPRDIFGRIHKEIVRTLATPEVKERLTANGFDVVGSSPEEFLRFVQNESDKLGKVIRDNDIKVE